MGRKVTDGKAIDVVAPDATAIVEGNAYRINNFTGFAVTAVGATDEEREFALDVTEGVWSIAVPNGVANAAGIYLKWSDNNGSFKDGAVNLVNETVAKTVLSVLKVVEPANARGNARVKLVIV